MQCFLKKKAEVILGSDNFVAENAVDGVEKMEGGWTRCGAECGNASESFN